MPKLAHYADYRIVAGALAEARIASGLTQTELARRLGAGQKLISVMETGSRRVDILEIFAIEDALDLAPLTLVERIFAAIARRQELEPSR